MGPCVSAISAAFSNNRRLAWPGPRCPLFFCSRISFGLLCACGSLPLFTALLHVQEPVRVFVLLLVLVGEDQQPGVPQPADEVPVALLAGLIVQAGNFH